MKIPVPEWLKQIKPKASHTIVHRVVSGPDADNNVKALATLIMGLCVAMGKERPTGDEPLDLNALLDEIAAMHTNHAALAKQNETLAAEFARVYGENEQLRIKVLVTENAYNASLELQTAMAEKLTAMLGNADGKSKNEAS